MWETDDISVQQNMCNITFEVRRLSTYVLKKYSEKKIFTIQYVVKGLKGFGWSSVCSASRTVRQHYFTIGQLLRVIRVVAFLRINRQCTRMAVRANTVQSSISASMLGQRRIRLTGIEPAMGCDAGPTLIRYWVGRPTLCVPGASYRRIGIH